MATPTYRYRGSASVCALQPRAVSLVVGQLVWRPGSLGSLLRERQAGKLGVYIVAGCDRQCSEPAGSWPGDVKAESVNRSLYLVWILIDTFVSLLW